MTATPTDPYDLRDILEEYAAETPHLAAHPTLRDVMHHQLDLIAAGEANGFSTVRSERELTHLTQMLEDLNAKRITPTKVIGTGVRSPLTTARAYLTGQIRLYRAASRVGAHVHTVNLINAMHGARDVLGEPAAAVIGEHRPRLAHQPYGADHRNTAGVAHIFVLTCGCGETFDDDLHTPTLDPYYDHVQPLIDAAEDEQ